MSDKFKIVDDLVSGDYIFDAYGETLEELFANCASACFHAMTDVEDIEKSISVNIEISGENIDELLFNFLSELIYFKDVNCMFFSDFKIVLDQDEKNIKAVVCGDSINYDKYKIKTDVKAVTYYGLKIIRRNNRFTVRVILDL